MNEKLEQAKNDVAKKLNYKDWEKCINDQPNYKIEGIMDNVAIRYHELMEEWISVDERLPKYDTYVNVSDGNDVENAWFGKRTSLDTVGFYFTNIKNITHWKPLPTPPKQ